MAERIISKDFNSTDKQIVTLTWTRWLDGSTIASSTWAAQNENGGSTTGLTVSDSSNTTTVATTYISGGSLDEEYWIVNTITTADGTPRTESRSIKVRVVRKLI